MYVICNCRRDASRKLREALGLFSLHFGTDTRSISQKPDSFLRGSPRAEFLPQCVKVAQAGPSVVSYTASALLPPPLKNMLLPLHSNRLLFFFFEKCGNLYALIWNENGPVLVSVDGVCLMLVSVNTGNDNTFQTCRLWLLKGALKIMLIASISNVHLLKLIQLWKSGAL